QVRVGDALEEVVAKSERKVKAVEALGSEHGEIVGPEIAVIEPRLVFDVGDEGSTDAAVLVGGLLDDGLVDRECLRGIVGMVKAVGEFEQGVHETASVAADG